MMTMNSYSHTSKQHHMIVFIFSNMFVLFFVKVYLTWDGQ